MPILCTNKSAYSKCSQSLSNSVCSLLHWSCVWMVACSLIESKLQFCLNTLPPCAMDHAVDCKYWIKDACSPLKWSKCIHGHHQSLFCILLGHFLLQYIDSAWNGHLLGKDILQHKSTLKVQVNPVTSKLVECEKLSFIHHLGFWLLSTAAFSISTPSELKKLMEKLSWLLWRGIIILEPYTHVEYDRPAWQNNWNCHWSTFPSVIEE